MTHITKELSDAILKSLYDTGHRFNSTWRQIILDIVEEFTGDDRSSLGFMGTRPVAEDLRGFLFNDFGSREPPYIDSGCWCVHKPMTYEFMAAVELSDVNTPWVDEDIVIGERWGKVGPKAAWFLERIRELNFMGTEDHWEFVYRGGMVGDNWWWNMCGVAGGNERLSGCLEEITWSVLIKYISFIREMSNWTMPLMPGPNTASRDCVDHWQRLMNGEVSGMGEGHVYECFNREQGERLPAAWNRIADFPRREHVVPPEENGGESPGNKKKMIHEIQGIIEQQVDEDKITEQKYKDLSELLMEFHKSIK
jgi:hypothetical protein